MKIEGHQDNIAKLLNLCGASLEERCSILEEVDQIIILARQNGRKECCQQVAEAIKAIDPNKITTEEGTNENC
nr:hypothetical protein 6 [Deltaproteobacteria bacterium]